MEYLEFLIRLSVIWSVLLLFYSWSMAKTDNWRLKRQHLLGIYLLGWLIPLLPAIPLAPSVAEWSTPILEQATFYIFPTSNLENELATNKWAWTSILLIIYVVGVVWQLIWLFIQYFELLYWKQNGERSSFRSFPLIRHKDIQSPFAGFGTIFLPMDQEVNSERMVCLHESIHLCNNHNRERIPLLLGNILLWFHPLQWVFNRWQTVLQEYEADEGVLQEFPLQSYGELLIRASMSSNKNWHPGFFSSPLKKRIHMMAKKKNHNGWKKSHYFLFLLLLSFIVVNCSDLVNQVDLSEKVEMLATEVDQGPSLKAVSSSDQETTPQRLLLEKIYREIRYPAEARNAGYGGTFKANFMVDETGKMTELAAEAISPEETNDLLKIVVVGYGNTEAESTSSPQLSQLAAVLEKEIKRTLSTLPDWNPAQHEGKVVPVKMTLFFQYKLE